MIPALSWLQSDDPLQSMMIRTRAEIILGQDSAPHYNLYSRDQAEPAEHEPVEII